MKSLILDNRDVKYYQELTFLSSPWMETRKEEAMKNLRRVFFY